MKKLIIIAFLPFMLKSQTIVIDSILPKTAMAAGYINSPWPTSLNTPVRVYTHSTGTWSPSATLILYFNSTAMITGTYQRLIDSSFVWGFKIPTCYSMTGYFPITLASGYVQYQVHACMVTEIDEIQKTETPIKTEYYNILGQPTKEGDLIIKIEYFDNGVIRRTKQLKE